MMTFTKQIQEDESKIMINFTIQIQEDQSNMINFTKQIQEDPTTCIGKNIDNLKSNMKMDNKKYRLLFKQKEFRTRTNLISK